MQLVCKTFRTLFPVLPTSACSLRCWLMFLQVQDFWVYTSTRDKDGRIVDTCKGDSGGPLVLWRNAGWELVGVLKVVFMFHFLEYKMSILFQGEGFDCATNRSDGDGEWSNVAFQHRWIMNQISLGGSKGVFGIF